MIRSFLALVPLALFAAPAFAQLPASPYTLSPVCTGPQCPRPATAIPTVRSGVAEVMYRAGDLITPHVQQSPQFVMGEQFPASIPVPACGPTRFAANPGERVISIAFPFLQRIGVRRIDVVLGLPTPFGQRIRRFR